MADEDLLKILQAHGQQFLQSFDSGITIGKRKEGPTPAIDRRSKKKKLDEPQSEEEWTGITGLGSGPSEDEEDSSEETFDEDGTGDDEEEDGDGMCPYIDLAATSLSRSIHQRTMSLPTKAGRTNRMSWYSPKPAQPL